MVDTEIKVPFPDGDDLRLSIAVGACRLALRPGGPEDWVRGTYTDPTGQLPPSVAQDGPGVRISQHYEVGGVLRLFQGAPSFDLALGTARPYSLSLEGGASENSLDLGGLPLVRLAVKHGAGTLDIDFSRPNPEAMTLLDIATGAGGLDARNLANANCAEMRLEGGAAAYRVHFGGSLQRHANARISTGVSSVEVIVPGTTAAKVTVDSVLGSLEVGDGWTTRESAFWTAAGSSAGAALLTVEVHVALGTLKLTAG